MIRFTKYNGTWALTGLEAELKPNAIVTVTKSGGVKEQVMVGALLTTPDASGMVVASLQKRVSFASGVGGRRMGRYAAMESEILYGAQKPAAAINPVLGLLSQAEALVKQAALMDPAPADQERKFFADLADAMKEFKNRRAVKAAQSA